MSDIINFGALQLRFLHSKDDTGGSVDIFEMTLQANARMPIPHYHDRWDETIYGLSGARDARTGCLTQPVPRISEIAYGIARCQAPFRNPSPVMSPGLVSLAKV